MPHAFDRAIAMNTLGKTQQANPPSQALTFEQRCLPEFVGRWYCPPTATTSFSKPGMT
jgi:hypothetical protein